MRFDSVAPDAIRAESRPIDYDFLPKLADSILDLGILSPIGIGPDMTLYYGAHRLAAAKEVGLERVPVVVLDTVQDRLDYLKVERDENAVRRTVKTTEQAELYREILELEQAAARQRQGVRSDLTTSEKISQRSEDLDREVRVSVTSKPVRAKEEAARAATGKAGRAKTLDKALAVMDAAADESLPGPVKAAAVEALAEVEATGKVDAAHKQVKAALTAAELVKQFPDLGYYFDKGDHDTVVRLGTALRAYQEPEQSMRLRNLKLEVEMQQRRAASPAPVSDEPDWAKHADAIWVAFNAAMQAFAKHGGVEAFEKAMPTVDRMTADMWREQCAQIIQTATALQGAIAPTLRAVN